MTPIDSLQTRPKMRKVCDELEKLAGDLGPNAQLPTMVQLRDSLGVSMKTLHDSLREMEKRQVLRSVHGVGIFVASPPQRVATGTIGFLVAARQTTVQSLSYFGMIIDGLRSEAGQHKQDLLLIDNNTLYENWEKLDGLVVSEAADARDPFPGLQPLPQGIPLVSILNRIPGVPNVGADDYQGTYLLTRHLLAQGHRRIAYLATLQNESTILKSRHNGYLAAMKEAGIEVDARWVRELLLREEWHETTDWYFLAGEYYTREWLSQDWEQLGCTALITQNDEAAFGALSAIKRAGLSVPGDISVTGFDGLAGPNRLLPQLTTIRAPLFEIGQQAVQMLAEQLSYPGQPVIDVRLPVQLIEGESSAPPKHS